MFPAFRLPAFAGLTCLVLANNASAQMFQDQTLAPFNRFPALSEYTSQCTIGDIDGDTDLDIIFANGSGFSCPATPQVLRIFVNNGTGVFSDNSAAATGSASFRARGVELGDIERDGD